MRDGAVERRIHPHLARFGLTKYWNLYVFRVADVPEPADGLRDAEQIAAVEQRIRLAEFLADPDDVARVKVVLGDDSFDGVPLIYANG